MVTPDGEFRVDCSTCGKLTPHRKFGNALEQDDEGRAFQRTECCECGAHTRLYENSEDSQENEN